MISKPLYLLFFLFSLVAWNEPIKDTRIQQNLLLTSQNRSLNTEIVNAAESGNFSNSDIDNVIIYCHRLIADNKVDRIINYFNSKIRLTDAVKNSVASIAKLYLVNGHYSKAQMYYEVLNVIDKKNENTFDRKIAFERIILGEIQPEYIQKFFVQIYRYTKLTNPPRPDSKTYEITADKIDEIIAQLKYIKVIIETFSKGKLSVDISVHYINSTVTKIVGGETDLQYAAPDFNRIHPFPYQLFLNKTRSSDVIFHYYYLPFQTYLFGGITHFPLIPYQLISNRRGVAYFNYSHKLSDRVVFHEYFHTCEGLFGFHIQDDFIKGEAAFKKIRNYIPNYDLSYSKYNSNDWNYYSWQFSINIPSIIKKWREQGNNIGWKQFSYATLYPISISEELYNNNIERLRTISLDDLEKSQNYVKLAVKAYGQNNKSLVNFYYKKALTLNPACLDAIKYFGDEAAKIGKILNSIRYYTEYFKYTFGSIHDNLNFAWILSRNVNYIEKANYYYSRAFGLAEKASDKHFIIYTWLSIYVGDGKKHYKPALELINKVDLTENSNHNLQLLFYKGYFTILTGDFDEGVRGLKNVIATKVGSEEYSGTTLRNLALEYLAKNDFNKALVIAKIGSLHKNKIFANECLFLYGEALYKSGDRKTGINKMKNALKNISGSNWQNRFTRIIQNS